MKKLTAALLAMSMTAGLLAGCGAPEPEETTAAETAAEAEETTAAEGETEAEAEAVNPEEYRVGLMIPGNLGDKSFFDAAFNSIEPIKEQLGVTVEYVECGTDTSKFYPALVDMCEADYDLILTISSNNDDALVQVAEEYPDQKFINLDDEMAEPPANVYIMGTKNNEMSYLAGAAGALKAAELGESTIGFVGGMDIPSINMFVAGYEAGAAYAGNGTTVERKYVGAWNDTSTGKELALALYDSGCDIVYQAAGGSGLGVFAAAEEKNLLAIGSDTNQCLIDPDHVFVSGIRTLNYIIRDGILAGRDGTLEPGSHSVGLKENGVSYTCEGSNIEVAQEILDSVETVKQQIIDGEITVPSTLEEVPTFIETYCGK